MTEWRTETIEDCLVRIPLAAVKKLQTQDYRASGLYPVIDQGQALIAGWTDDESGLISQDLPVVVFGDHTRIFKFIDFPFVRGADGTQVLKPKSGINPLFFFYALRAVDLPSRGYNRHFKALKEKEVSIPSPAEQAQIAQALKLVEDALNVQYEELRALERCKGAAMQTLFTRGLRGEAQQETDIGPLPETWETRLLENAAIIYSSSRLNYSELLGREDDDGEDTVRVLGIKVIDMARSEAESPLSEAELSRKISRAEAEHRCIPPGAIVFPKNGAAVATNKKRRVSDCCVLDPNVMALHAKGGVEQAYLYQWLQSFDLKTIVKPGPVPNFGKGDISSVLVPVPSTIAEQQEIVAILEAIDRKIDLHRRKRAVLNALFEALLHKLMTGEIGVADLDISALNRTAPVAEVAA